MTERSALLLAGSAHLALLAALSLSWALTHREIATVDAVPVEIVDIGDVPTITEKPKPSLKAAPREASYEPTVGPEAARGALGAVLAASAAAGSAAGRGTIAAAQARGCKAAIRRAQATRRQ